MMSKWLVGIGSKPRQYTVNGVKYVVSSRFVDEGETLKGRLQSYIKSDFADLTMLENDDIMTGEYACSAAVSDAPNL